MSRNTFLLLLATLTLSAIAYPLFQWATNAGWVYYLNGFDEFTYLQYDYSLASQAVTRPGQYIVSLAHQAGLSGGMINLLLDSAALLALPLLAAAAVKRLGWDGASARSAAVILLGLPLLLGGINPLIDQLNRWNEQSGMIQWLTVPHLLTPALLRSPEPQLSLLLLALSVLAALKWRTFWPVYVVLPFLYPFVAIPTAFIVLACDMHRRWPTGWGFGTVGPLALAFLLTSCAITAYFHLLVPHAVRDLMVATRLPLVSFTGVITVGVVMAAWNAIHPTLRFSALAIAMAPWVAANHQWLSGHIAQPNNVEQYFGTLAFALVVAMATNRFPAWRSAVVVVSVVLFLRSSHISFRTNQVANDTLPLTPALLDALRHDPGHTAINDVHMASVMNLVLPRQGPTALSYAQTFVGLSERLAPQYRSAKRRILTEQHQDPGFMAALRFLDSAYMYGGQNIPLIHIFRKSTFKQLQDVTPAGEDQSGQPLRYFTTSRPGASGAD